MSKVMAALGIVVGALSTFWQLLDAFGVNVTSAQETAIAAVAGVVLLVLGVWFHPAVPFGVKDQQ